ncbi:hypothetical protein KIPB_010627, partial [Kipferlia bialata]|eukprot:g10627.t1
MAGGVVKLRPTTKRRFQHARSRIRGVYLQTDIPCRSAYCTTCDHNAAVKSGEGESTHEPVGDLPTLSAAGPYYIPTSKALLQSPQIVHLPNVIVLDSILATVKSASPPVFYCIRDAARESLKPRPEDAAAGVVCIRYPDEHAAPTATSGLSERDAIMRVVTYYHSHLATEDGGMSEGDEDMIGSLDQPNIVIVVSTPEEAETETEGEISLFRQISEGIALPSTVRAKGLAEVIETLKDANWPGLDILLSAQRPGG